MGSAFGSSGIAFGSPGRATRRARVKEFAGGGQNNVAVEVTEVVAVQDEVNVRRNVDFASVGESDALDSFHHEVIPAVLRCAVVGVPMVHHDRGLPLGLDAANSRASGACVVLRRPISCLDPTTESLLISEKDSNTPRTPDDHRSIRHHEAHDEIQP
jgi:hypothetical protein